MRNLFVHCCCNDRLFSYSVPIFIFKLILTIYTVYRAQSFRIRVGEDGIDNFKQTFYNVSTQTHFLSKGVLLNVSRRGKRNFQTGRAICSIFTDFKRF